MSTVALAVALVCILACVLVHTFVVARYLRRRGGSASTGAWSWNHFGELSTYKALRLGERQSLLWWRLEWALFIAATLSVLAFLALAAA